MSKICALINGGSAADKNEARKKLRNAGEEGFPAGNSGVREGLSGKGTSPRQEGNEGESQGQEGHGQVCCLAVT